jgi:hypothetical protein
MFHTLKVQRSQKLSATRRNLQVQPKILKKLSKHEIYQSEQKFSQKKVNLNLKSVKEPKICMEASRRNLPREPEKQKDST